MLRGYIDDPIEEPTFLAFLQKRKLRQGDIGENCNAVSTASSSGDHEPQHVLSYSRRYRPLLALTSFPAGNPT
ncbi:hypothetical protein TWF569_001699 [Orbilia oligospora]|uniref:Uncharacterized protein n=1 Tax=Orbilia oligospora TaxID=2813651 RepID=A0A7C8J641_ORBOL|nr:hypothetical protein TWF102_001016 [Orbilia oligospora]KAF3123611.1 hypothetical protein TWF569_001699 [Orbilia oligospora]KAF3135140.1 hypothetical protein TWF594_008528 [Orbilia oligospora]